MMNLLINGCNGRMGQALAQTAVQHADIRIVAGVDRFPGAQKNAFPVYGSIAECMEQADVIVDFSRPEALPDLLEWALPRGCAIVLCTTGLSPEDIAMVGRASAQIAIFRSANMSLGVNLAVDLCKRAAAFLGDGCDVEIIEKHHNTKADSPSGTALMIADAINDVYLKSRNYVYGRHSMDQKRSRGEIGIHAVRGGTIVGEHETLFIAPDEIVTVRHEAQSRQVFAAGALRAALFLAGRAPGLYSMQDMLTEISAVTAISTDEGQSLVSVGNLPAGKGHERRIFSTLWKGEISIDMISEAAPYAGRVSLAFTLPRDMTAQALPMLRACLAGVEGVVLGVREDIVKISIEGPGMERQPGVAGRFYESLGDAGVEALAVTTSETKVSCCVPEISRRAAVEALIKEFKL